MRISRSWVVVALIIFTAPEARAVGQAGSVDRGNGPMGDAMAIAARIDRALAERWEQTGVEPVAFAEDGEFLRRASIDLIGKIPTAAEARDFLDDPRPNKRAALVERLLDSPAYVRRAAELWREVLLPEAETEDQARLAAGGLEAWLRRQVVQEAGYDRIVRAILTAELGAMADGIAVNATSGVGSTPAAYYLAKGRQPEDLAAGASRVFLGIRLECAQCHDHPFASWKREEFWSFAAFFAGVQPTPDAGSPGTMARSPAARRELTIPGTGQVVEASHLDGTELAWRPRADARELLADWMTAPENPYFARAVVNRVWARLFGVGLIEPVDDLDSGADPMLGGLLDELAVAFRSSGYDLKFLIRVLTATRAYNLSSEAPPGADFPPPDFACMPVRGLSPGQLFDSLARATGVNGEAHRARVLELFANREERPTEAQSTILQALTLMNGSFVATATGPETGDMLGAIAEAPFLDSDGRIEALFLTTLTRRPRPDEREELVRYVDRGSTPEARAAALADVFWAILNGPEFRFNH